MPTLWFISCDLCYNLHTLLIQVLFRPFSTMAVNILVNFDLRSHFSRFACPNSFKSYVWEFILHGPSIGTDWCRVMIILRAQVLITSLAECHSFECDVLAVFHPYLYFFPVFILSSSKSSFHHNFLSLFHLHCDDYSMSDWSLPYCLILPTSFDWWSLLLLFLCNDLTASTRVGIYCSTSGPHRTINLLLILRLGFATLLTEMYNTDQAHLMLDDTRAEVIRISVGVTFILV